MFVEAFKIMGIDFGINGDFVSTAITSTSDAVASSSLIYIHGDETVVYYGLELIQSECVIEYLDYHNRTYCPLIPAFGVPLPDSLELPHLTSLAGSRDLFYYHA